MSSPRSSYSKLLHFTLILQLFSCKTSQLIKRSCFFFVQEAAALASHLSNSDETIKALTIRFNEALEEVDRLSTNKQDAVSAVTMEMVNRRVAAVCLLSYSHRISFVTAFCTCSILSKKPLLVYEDGPVELCSASSGMVRL